MDLSNINLGFGKLQKAVGGIMQQNLEKILLENNSIHNECDVDGILPENYDFEGYINYNMITDFSQKLMDDAFPQEIKEEVNNVDVAKQILADQVKELLQNNTNNNVNIETSSHDNKDLTKKDVFKKLFELKGDKFPEEDGDYWTDIIHTNYANYNFPTDLQLEIFSKECGLNRNVNSRFGAGCSQVTKTTINDFFPGAHGNRIGMYKMINEDLLNDILYKKNDDGSFMVDNSGKKIKKYKSTSELRNACAKDDQLASQVGMLCLQMKYVEAVKRGSGKSIKETIQALKDGTIDLPEDKNKIYLQRALANYNSVFRQYAPSLIKKLEKNGYDFSTNLLFNGNT